MPSYKELTGSKPKLIVTDEKYSVEFCEKNSDKVILFGDNCLRNGKGGQAVIRYCRNAIGVRTKKFPSMEDNAFFTDKEYTENCKVIDEDLDRALRTGKDIIVSSNGLGTGLAELFERAPKTYHYLQTKLAKIQRGE